MSYINVIANNSLLEDLNVNDVLTVDNLINTNNLIVSGNITLASTATFDGSFISEFDETETFIDGNGNTITNTETIDLYEKIERIESKISANTIAHANNAGAIASRYTKTAADSRFVNNANAQITGDINIRAVETDPFESLTTKLNRKVETTTLTTDYTTTTNLNIELNKKVDIEDFATTYLSHLAPLASPSLTGTVLINDLDLIDFINTNSNNIQTNSNNIQTNTNAIQANATAIQTNATAIQTNANAIQANATAIQTNTTNITTNSTNITTNTTAIQANATAIQTNITAIQTKEAIEHIKVMINMLAMSVQPNFITIDNNINGRIKFARNDTEAANMSFTSLNFSQSIYFSTDVFLQDFYEGFGYFIQNTFIGFNYVSQYDISESGTDGDMTGGFFYKHKRFEDFPNNTASYKIYFEDDYVCNKAGLLSLPQILRTGNLTFTLVDSLTYTITAQYPDFTI